MTIEPQTTQEPPTQGNEHRHETDHQPEADVVQDPGPVVEQAVGEAIRPVIADLRETLARAVEQQLEHQEHPDQFEAQKEALQPAEKAPDVRPASSGAAPPEAERSAEPSAGEAPHEAEGAKEDSEGTGFVKSLINAVSTSVQESNGPIREMTADVAQGLVGTMLDAFFSDSTRASVEQLAREGMASLLDDMLDVIPDRRERMDVQRQGEAAIGSLLDDLFSESTRARFQPLVEQVVGALVMGEADAAKRHAQQALQIFVTAIMRALQDHWQQVVAMLVKVMARRMQVGLASAVQENFTNKVQREVKADAGSLQERVREKSENVRYQVADAVERLQQRVKEALPTATVGGSRGGIGRPPSLRPPSGRRQLGRPPSGRAPVGRPPSARQLARHHSSSR